MKKLLLVLCIVAMAFGLVACSHDCDTCGKSGAEKYELFGQEVYLCDDCRNPF
ncbi:MAG: hypothetical protein IKJ55_06285 [Clostridia bacterium]|nr:hypothetical protein [Clostridia bacterium]